MAAVYGLAVLGLLGPSWWFMGKGAQHVKAPLITGERRTSDACTLTHYHFVLRLCRLPAGWRAQRALSDGPADCAGAELREVHGRSLPQHHRAGRWGRAAHL